MATTPSILKINGKNVRVGADLSTPLLYVLRNDLELNAPRFGCGLAQCGTCSVLVNGQATRSCVLPIRAVLASSGVEIRTLEGLGDSKNPSPVQQAFIDEQAVQCGYCVNGQIIGATALLQTIPSPSDEEIKEAMNPYLCRCGTYPRVVKAIKRAASSIRETENEAE